MRRTERPRKPRMGALPPRYSFVLNPHARDRFTRCPQCEASTRVRKIPLVIHVDSVGLITARKTCRLCVVCEMLIAHQDEIENSGRSVTCMALCFKSGSVNEQGGRRKAAARLSDLAQI